MPARKSVAKFDHASEGLFGHSEITETPDAEPARVYDNKGTGLSNVSGQNYNEAHGRESDAPTVGYGHEGR